MVRDGADAAQWRRFFAIEQPLLASVPPYPAVGNHELVDDAGGANYHRYFVLPGEGDEEARPAPTQGDRRALLSRFQLFDQLIQADA